MENAFDVTKFDVKKYNTLLKRGLCVDVGTPNGQMCIEAVICNVLGMDHDDDPLCVTEAVREFKIELNDSSSWSSPHARAKGLKQLGLAQLDSKGIVNGVTFNAMLRSEVICKVVPLFIKTCYPDIPKEIINALKTQKNNAAVVQVNRYIRKNYKVPAFPMPKFSDVIGLTNLYIFDIDTAEDFLYYVKKKVPKDFYQNMIAEIALKILKKLKSPGCKLLK